MASFNSIEQQITALIPNEQKDQYTAVVPEWVSSAVEEVSKLREWDWRKRLASISITTSDVLYSMPADCDMISSEPAVLLDTNDKPTENRVVLLPWDTFNQRYIDGEGDTETASTPQFMVPWPEPSGLGAIQIRTYPISDATYTLSVPYYTIPSANDALYMLDSLVIALVRSKMPQSIEPDSFNWLTQYRLLKRELIPHEGKAKSYKPLWTYNPAFVKHQDARRNRK